MGARPLRAEAGDASAPAPSAAAGAVRLWSISDVHTDIEDNLAWVDAISDTAYTNDALIVAGDVSDRMDVLERTLSTLQRKFREVFFVPGNHDLWAEANFTMEASVTLAGLDGAEIRIRVSGCTLGRELLRLARSQLPQKPGCALRLSLCGVELWPDESLEAQGVQAETGTVISYAYSRVCLLKAWNALKGHARDAEQALEGTTKLCFHNPINSLLGVTLPSTLKSLTFGDEFDQRLQEITLPGSLQNLTFGHDFNHFVILPSSLQNLTFGNAFNQSLEGVTLPSSLQNLTFGHAWNRSMGSDFARQPTDPDFWRQLQPTPAGSEIAGQPAKLDIWRRLRPKFAGNHFAKQPAKADIWRQL
ncbi:unnamed protein product [Effrenium voratum]|nr:unnamed protein product [Effrenium voratum]